MYFYLKLQGEHTMPPRMVRIMVPAHIVISAGGMIVHGSVHPLKKKKMLLIKKCLEGFVLNKNPVS